MELRTILHATDYSEHSQAALEYAVDLAGTFGARLIVLHTVATLGAEGVSFGEAAHDKQPETYRRHLWDDLHKHARAKNPHVEVEYVLSEDEPAKAITELATERDCDLIVLGSHGRHGLKRLLEGSVAEHAMRWAPCPVLIVKARQPVPSKASPENQGTELHPHYLYEQAETENLSDGPTR